MIHPLLHLPHGGHRLLVLGTPVLLDAAGRTLRAVTAQPKRLVLLAFLVHAGRPVARRTLLRWFWPHLTEARGRNALNQALHFLRHKLGDVFHRHGRVAVEVPSSVIAYDVGALREAAAARSPAALDLYRGLFLEGLPVTGSNHLQTWVDSERAGLAGLARDTAVSAALEAEARGELSRSLEFAARAAAIAPLDEVAATLHVRLLASAGHPTDALREAERFRLRLLSEVEMHPSPTFGRLVEEIRS